MSESVWAMLVYFLLQAAVPALLPVPMIVSEWRQPSYRTRTRVP